MLFSFAILPEKCNIKKTFIIIYIYYDGNIRNHYLPINKYFMIYRITLVQQVYTLVDLRMLNIECYKLIF